MRLDEGITRFVMSKRAAGVAFVQSAHMLNRFKRHVGDVALSEVTVEDIASFLRLSIRRPYVWHAHYNLLKRFLEHWAQAAEIEPMLMPEKRVRVRSVYLPYVYSVAEVRRLLEGTGKSQSSKACEFDAKCFRAILFVLFATGMTVGEVLRLKHQDLDMRRRIIKISASPLHRGRIIPVSLQFRTVIREFCSSRFNRAYESGLLFVTRSGEAIQPDSLRRSFRRLVKQCGVRRRDGISDWPRMTDFRASFAVLRIADWLKRGTNLNAMLPALSAYLGLSCMQSMDKYMRLTPERFIKPLKYSALASLVDLGAKKLT